MKPLALSRSFLLQWSLAASGGWSGD